METETKVCKECGREMPISLFKLTRWGNRAEVCNDCANQKLRASLAENKRKLIDEQHQKEVDARKLRLRDFSPRELMEELARRGYKGNLTFVETHVINIENF